MKHPIEQSTEEEQDQKKLKQNHAEDLPEASIEDSAVVEPVPAGEIEDGPESPDEVKVRIGNVGKHRNKKDIQKLLQGLNLTHGKIKISPQWTFAYVNFTQPSAALAIEKLEGFQYKGSVLYAKIMKAEQELPREPKEDKDDQRTPQERINDQVTPLWRVNYEDQLTQKQDQIKQILTRLKKELFKYFKKNKNSPSLVNDEDFITQLKKLSPEERAFIQLDWLKEAVKKYDNLPCPLEDMTPSPVTEGYRSKCEFSFGKDLDGKKSLGFLLGMFKDGFTTVLNPSSTMNVPETAKVIANGLEQYSQASSLDTYDRATKKGFFRLVQVRTLHSGQNMVLFQVNPDSLSSEQLQSEKEQLRDYLLEFASTNHISIDSLYWQESTQSFNGIKEEDPMELIHGSKTIVEKLMGLDFRISPTAFFQINHAATELLYGKIRDISTKAAQLASAELQKKIKNGSETASEDGEKPGVVLLDLCCGTGTIGIALAKHVKKVIGVEMCVEAVEDAKQNALDNGITNAHFIAGKVEDKMHGVFKYHVHKNDTVIAVLDPPRTGVHYSVIKAIRECKDLKHVVFVACDLNQSLQNIIDLCRPMSNKYQGHSFVPVKAMGVDLFPHTKHFEVVIELVRQQDSDFLEVNE